MAISIIGQPDSVHPVFNPVIYYVDSTNKNQPSFRYVVQIFPAGGSTPIAEFKIAPRPLDGYGYVDVSKILQTRISRALNTSSSTWISADNFSDYAYDVKFGEEFVQTWNFNSYGSSTIGGIAYTRLIQTVTIPGNAQFFGAIGSSGQQIQTTLTPPLTPTDFRNALQGYFTILNIVDNYQIDISLPYIGAGTGVPGSTKFADNRKVQILNLASLSNRVAFNRAYSFKAWPSYAQTQIIANNSSTEILTDAPDDFTIWEWQSLYWNFFDNKTNNVQCVLFENDGGDEFQINTSSTGAFIKQVDVSPNATLSLLSGTAPLVKSTTKWYDVWATSLCCNDCQAIDVINTGTGPFNVSVTPAGTSNGAPYYTWNVSGTPYCLFYDPTLPHGWELRSGITVPSTSLGTVVATWNGPISILNCPPITGVPSGAFWFNTGGFVFSTVLTPCGTQTTEKKRIYIDDRCPINTTQLMFLDRAGSWSSFGFTLRTRETGTINRRSYLKELGDLSGGKYTYDVEEAGETTYHVDFSKQYVLNTDWMSDGMSEYFEQLLTSPEVYVRFQDSDTFWLRCVIVDNSFITERKKNKKLIRKTITVKLANEDPINV